MTARIIHIVDGTENVLAKQAERGDSFRKQLIGVMFKSKLPDDYGLVFSFRTARKRGIHMVFVFVPIDVIWVEGGEVTGISRLEPWTGFGRYVADRVIELPAGVASDVSVGDRIEIRE